jgi:acetoin utilization deacetylase AcuC-like enzyme
VALHAWTSARWTVPLPDGHRFPIAKYARLRDRVLSEALVLPERLHEPEPVSREDLLLVHEAAYLAAVESGEMGATELRRIGFPWSAALVERAKRAVGGTCEAAAAALEHGVAVNLAGGTHHAFPAHGEGYCVFNDVAVAIRALQQRRRIRRAAVIDLDVHQGNGTHAIFAGDDSAFTFSMHGRRNYPFRKVPGSLDVELDDGTADEFYLDMLALQLPRVLAQSRPDLVVYLAGADPHEGDTLGRLRLSFDGLARRDAMVLSACREIGVPSCVTIAGGYGARIDDTVQVHLNTVRVAASYA